MHTIYKQSERQSYIEFLGSFDVVETSFTRIIDVQYLSDYT